MPKQPPPSYSILAVGLTELAEELFKMEVGQGSSQDVIQKMDVITDLIMLYLYDKDPSFANWIKRNFEP